jgi:RNA polymerase sigma factor (sigma-70 family)
VKSGARTQQEERLEALTQERERWLAFLRPRLASGADAEDILHDSLLRAMHRVGDVRREEDLFAWFYRVLRHAAVDSRRREAARSKRNDRFAEEAAAEWETALRSDPLRAQFCGCIRSRLPDLPPRYARLVETVDLGGATPAEAASREGASLNAINVTLHRARQALRRELVRFCGACAEQACLDCGCEPTAGNHSIPVGNHSPGV